MLACDALESVMAHIDLAVAAAPLNRQQIAQRIPHADAMCLLDSASYWDAQHIVASASSHRSIDNPLRQDGWLSALCAIEYAGQAMALHGSLLADSPGSLASVGFLASVREVTLRRSRLDDLTHPLEVRATRFGGDAAATLYSFEVWCDSMSIVTGRVTVSLHGPAV